MDILFLTMYNFRSFSDSGIYEDLMREFVKNGHRVFAVSPTEKRNGERTNIARQGDGFSLLRVRTGNLQKTNIIEKGIATVRVAAQFTTAIKKHFRGVKFDLIMYSTPPITLVDTIEYFKKRDSARTFLLLKDIFPQNALDIGVLNKRGLKGVIYKYFRKKEKNLYAISDHIGCMSEANKRYVSDNNPETAEDKLSVVPNGIEPKDVSQTSDEKTRMREKYGLPQDKTVFVYGGNLGKPQDIPFVIECFKRLKTNKDAFFFIVGDGTEYGLLEEFVETERPENLKVMKRIPRDDFDGMVASCDVGMIFLDHRFTIPNYPSRLLSYMQAGIPVLACTDPNTDVGKDIASNGFGLWCESNDSEKFCDVVNDMIKSDLKAMGERAKKYLDENFTVAESYKIIMEQLAKGTEK